MNVVPGTTAPSFSGPRRGGEQDQAGRGGHGGEPDVERVLCRRRKLSPAPQHRARLIPPEADRAPCDRGQRVEARPQLGDDAEVPAPAAQGPQQVGLVVRIGGHNLAIGEHDLGRQQVVDPESGHADQGSVAAAESQAGEPGRADVAHCGRVTVRSRRVEDVAHGGAAGHASLSAVDGDPSHVAQVHQQAAVPDGAAGPVMASA
jgi:hypothetical protein